MKKLFLLLLTFAIAAISATANANWQNGQGNCGQCQNDNDHQWQWQAGNDDNSMSDNDHNQMSKMMMANMIQGQKPAQKSMTSGKNLQICACACKPLGKIDQNDQWQMMMMNKQSKSYNDLSDPPEMIGNWGG